MKNDELLQQYENMCKAAHARMERKLDKVFSEVEMDRKNIENQNGSSHFSNIISSDFSFRL